MLQLVVFEVPLQKRGKTQTLSVFTARSTAVRRYHFFEHLAEEKVRKPVHSGDDQYSRQKHECYQKNADDRDRNLNSLHIRLNITLKYRPISGPPTIQNPLPTSPGNFALSWRREPLKLLNNTIKQMIKAKG